MSSKMMIYRIDYGEAKPFKTYVWKEAVEFMSDQLDVMSDGQEFAVGRLILNFEVDYAGAVLEEMGEI